VVACRARRWISFARRAVRAVPNCAHGFCLFHEIHRASTSRRSVSIQRSVCVGKSVRQLRTRARQPRIVSAIARLFMAAPRADREHLYPQHSRTACPVIHLAHLFISPLAAVCANRRAKIQARAKSLSRRDLDSNAHFSAFRHRRTIFVAINSCGDAVDRARTWHGGWLDTPARKFLVRPFTYNACLSQFCAQFPLDDYPVCNFYHCRSHRYFFHSASDRVSYRRTGTARQGCIPSAYTHAKAPNRVLCECRV